MPDPKTPAAPAATNILVSVEAWATERGIASAHVNFLRATNPTLDRATVEEFDAAFVALQKARI